MSLDKFKSIAFGIAKAAVDNRTGLIDLALTAAKLAHGDKDDQKKFAKKVLNKVQAEVNDEVRKHLQATIDQYEKKKGFDIPDEIEKDIVELVADTLDAVFDAQIEDRLLSLID